MLCNTCKQEIGQENMHDLFICEECYEETLPEFVVKLEFNEIEERLEMIYDILKDNVNCEYDDLHRIEMQIKQITESMNRVRSSIA